MSYREDLKAYLDGELPVARATEIAHALETDASLRREYEQLQSICSAVQAGAKEISIEGYELTLSKVSASPRHSLFSKAGRNLALGGVLSIIIAAVWAWNAGTPIAWTFAPEEGATKSVPTASAPEGEAQSKSASPIFAEKKDSRRYTQQETVTNVAPGYVPSVEEVVINVDDLENGENSVRATGQMQAAAVQSVVKRGNERVVTLRVDKTKADTLVRDLRNLVFVPSPAKERAAYANPGANMEVERHAGRMGPGSGLGAPVPDAVKADGPKMGAPKALSKSAGSTRLSDATTKREKKPAETKTIVVVLRVIPKAPAAAKTGH